MSKNIPSWRKRKIDGKIFILTKTTTIRSEADKYAKNKRRSGYLARVVKGKTLVAVGSGLHTYWKSTPQYKVYTRKKFGGTK